jgi:holo-ACP synthase
MSCDALRSELLAARDQRQKLLDGLFPSTSASILMLSLNLPGPCKTGPYADRLFYWGEQALLAVLPVIVVQKRSDTLGPFALYQVQQPAASVKRVSMDLENRGAAGRLLDLDIYDHSGQVVDRASLGFPPRTCLLCPDAAIACIRAQRHTSAALQAQAFKVIDAL